MDESPIAFHRAMFLDCRRVHEFLNVRMRPRIAYAAGSAESRDAFFGLYLRVLAWLRTLWKLDEPGDFQAVTVASRTLFEIAVDLTIMHFDAKANPPAKMDAWEDSAKLKAARRVRTFVDRPGSTESETDYRPFLTFLSKNEQRVKALRLRWWPPKQGKKSEPPERWTGRNLSDDAAKATDLYRAGKFDAYYARRYSQNCWNTHGSGLAGVRGVPAEDFPALASLAFSECAQYALIAAEMALRHFCIWETAIPEFEALHRERARANADVLGITPADLGLVTSKWQGRLLFPLPLPLIAGQRRRGRSRRA